MDRQIVYPSSIPQDTDVLNTNKGSLIALGRLCAALFGTGGLAYGLPVSPTSPPGLNVNVGAGEIYQLENVDNTPYGSLSVDTTDQIVKQGILLQSAAPLVLACQAPTTSGFSINYLIEATYADADINDTVLPYYNANNPEQPYAGPNNDGQAQATTRAGTVSIQAKAGIAAATGTQTTPTLDAGYIALAVVTVANGQTTIVSGNIVTATGGQILSEPITSGRLLNVQVFNTAGTFTYTPTPGTNKVRVTVQGGGGGAGGCAATGASQTAIGSSAAGGGAAVSLLTSGFAGVSVVVGAAGVGGSAGANAGTAGGTSSFGSLLSATGGGLGAAGIIVSVLPNLSGVTAGGLGIGGNILNAGGNAPSYALAAQANGISSGSGGNSPLFGGGGYPVAIVSGSTAGQNATSPGGGGSGAAATASSAAKAGGNGFAGLVIVEEIA